MLFHITLLKGNWNKNEKQTVLITKNYFYNKNINREPSRVFIKSFIFADMSKDITQDINYNIQSI